MIMLMCKIIHLIDHLNKNKTLPFQMVTMVVNQITQIITMVKVLILIVKMKEL